MQDVLQNGLYSLEDLGFTIGEKGKVSSFCAEKFVEKFLLEHKMVMDENSKYYIFNDIFWEELSQDEMTLRLKKFMDRVQNYLWKSSYEKETLHFMKFHVTKVKEMNPYRYMMPFKDFDFDFRVGGILDKEPNRYFTYVKDISEQDLESRKCPVFEKLINDISQGDTDFKRYLLQMCGILLSGENRKNLIFIVFGNGANSKSIFSKLIEHMIGRQFIASRKLDSFSEKYSIGGLEGKKLVSCGESETSKPINIAMIKSITGNDTVQSELKHQNIKSVELCLNFLFLTNKLQRIADNSEGAKRRLHIIEFKHQVPKNERDPELFEKLVKEEAGIFKMILDSYSEMISEDGKMDFVMSENVKEFTEKFKNKYLIPSDYNYIDETDSCIDFLHEYFEIGTKQDKIVKSQVYDLYCREIKDINEETFWKALSSELKRMNVTIKRNGKRFLEGIKIKDVYKHKIPETSNISNTHTFPHNKVTIGVRKVNMLQNNQDIDEVV